MQIIEAIEGKLLITVEHVCSVELIGMEPYGVHVVMPHNSYDLIGDDARNFMRAYSSFVNPWNIKWRGHFSE